jgi:diadenosine tetraphosphate (Ap4A) HIT family hydrolase
MEPALQTISFTVTFAADIDVPGYLLIRPRRSVRGPHDLTANELVEFGLLQGLCAEVINVQLQPERIYLLIFGESDGLLHQHILARTTALTAKQ